ncbi:hypothetical protein [Kitasatospora sp. NPDC088548]|uniref:hypothetical protein n=1 Tax=Kitasatospora sp. NPDC088548 TaxID=3364075 RepID=UPI00381C8CD8
MKAVALSGAVIAFAGPSVLAFAGLYRLSDPARRSTLRWAGGSVLAFYFLSLVFLAWR